VIGLRGICLILRSASGIKEDRQYTYNVSLRLVHATIVAVVEQ